jgi:hypothetical protein
MGEKELRVDALEVHRLSLTCLSCHSEAVFEAGAVRGPGGIVCPNCSAPMPHATELVTVYREFFRMCTAAKATLGVSFRVPLDE